MNIPFAALVAVIDMTAASNIDLASVFVMSAFLGGLGALFGFVIAAYAQRKIDRLPMS